ncbi:MAG: DUF4397 domain-containing protein [Betaproteobacteria bacterium]|nr:DUF4397 domain-containing protein [Betaproteobacteria bacterium]
MNTSTRACGAWLARAGLSLHSLIGAATIALLFTGCTAEGQKQNIAKVRVFNAVFASPGVKVSVPEKELANGLAYEGRTGYVDLTSGVIPFTVTSASGEKLAEANFTLGNERPATFVVTGIGTTLGGLLFDDQVSPPQDGRVRVRFAHAASGVIPLDAYLTRPADDIATLFPTYSAQLGLFTNFSEFNADTYILRMTISGTKDVVYQSDPIVMASREMLTLLAYSSGSNRMVTAAKLSHGSDGAITTLPTKVARVRVANAVTAPIDVLLDAVSQSTNIAQAAYSNGFNATGGAPRTLRIDANATAGTPLASGAFTFTPGRDYTILAMGSGTSATLTQFLDNSLSATGGTRIRMRLINAVIGGEAAELKLGTTLLSTAAPGAAGAYSEFDVGTFDLTVTGTGTGASYFSLPQRVYTAAEYNIRYAVLVTGTPGDIKAAVVAE